MLVYKKDEIFRIIFERAFQGRLIRSIGGERDYFFDYKVSKISTMGGQVIVIYHF